jgi:hypothetical protein
MCIAPIHNVAKRDSSRRTGRPPTRPQPALQTSCGPPVISSGLPGSGGTEVQWHVTCLSKAEDCKAMSKQNATVVICRSHRSAEAVVNALQESAYDVQKLAIIGRDCSAPPKRPAEAPAALEVKQRAELRSFWCRMWRRLPGGTFINVRGIGPVLVAGAIADWLAATGTDLMVQDGRDPLRTGLIRIGVPRGSSIKYEAALQADYYLVVAYGRPGEVMRAKEIMQSAQAA